MFFKDILTEYEYYCLARGFTEKTMRNKRQEYKQLYEYLSVRRGIEQLESITSHDMKAYIKTKHNANLKPQSIVSMAKQIRDGFTSDEVVAMIDAFNYKDYINARNKAIVAMLADTGLRAIEITNLPSDAVKNINMLVIGKGRKDITCFAANIN